jgi:hypothetical protein
MAKTKIDVVSDPRSGLLPDPRVADRYQVTSRTICRWDTQPNLGFPKPHSGSRRYARRSVNCCPAAAET